MGREKRKGDLRRAREQLNPELPASAAIVKTMKRPSLRPYGRQNTDHNLLPLIPCRSKPPSHRNPPPNP
eukprot:1394944-Amorphochlora_amoeboformis.AAC.1